MFEKFPYMGPRMISEVMLSFIESLRLHNVSIHVNFHQNRCIESCTHRVPNLQSFFCGVKELMFVKGK